jgi:hypothetical protein
MLPKIGSVSVIAALLGVLSSLPANATTVIYSFQYTEDSTGGTVPFGTVVGTGQLKLNLSSPNVQPFTNISSSQNTADFVSFTNTFGSLVFNYTTIGNNGIGISGNTNDALNNFNFQTSAGGDNFSVGLTSFSLNGPNLNEGNKVTLLSFGPAVPEPSTWAMMILGFVGIGAMTYRRRKSAMLAA